MPLPAGYQWTGNTGYFQEYKEPTRDEIETDRAEFDPTADWDYQNDKQLGPQGQALPQGAEGWRPTGDVDWGAGLGGWWKKTMYNVGNAYQTGYEEGLQITAVGKIAVATQNVSGGRGQQATEAEKEKVQQAITTEQESRKPKNETQAQIFGVAEALKESFNSVLGGVLEGLGEAAVKTEQAAGAVAYSTAQAIQGQDVDWSKNFQAGRMMYAALFDDTIREEMNRRLDAGERGDIAAEKIMIEKPWTLWPQLIGQLVFDPLNVVSAWGKAGEAVRLQKNAAKTFHTIENPAVRAVLEQAGDFSKLDDVTAYQKLQELAKTQQGLLAATSHAEDIVKATGNLEELSKSYKLANMTSDGKIAHLANQTSEVLMHIVNNSDPEEALEIFRGIVKSVSSDPAEAAEGMAAMLHFADAPALFSEAGNNTTVLLGRMYEKHGDDWLKVLDELKDNPTELTKNLLGKLDEAGQEMFPSVSKMLEAESAVKAAKNVEELPVATRQLAERAKDIPDWVKNVTRFHDKAQTVVSPINKGFATVYMGWSPGYAFRNWSNNTLQILIDHGPAALLGSADNMLAKAEQIHGGTIMGAVGFGESGALFAEKATTGGTDIKSTIQAIKEETKLLGKEAKGPAQIMAAKMEENAAKRIISKTYMDTFNKGVKALTKSLSKDLRAAGFSDDIINKLPTYILQNQGDATSVINALRKDVASGVIDLFNDIDRIDPKYKSFLSDVGKWDEYADTVLKAATKEEATAAARKIFDDLAQAGDYVYRDGHAVTDNYGKFLKMAEQGGLSEPRGYLIEIRKTTSRSAIEAAESILAEADDLGAKLGLEVGSMKRVRGITGLNTWGGDAAKEADRLNKVALKLYRDAQKGGDLRQMWQTFPEFFTGAPPANLDYSTFADALWTQYDTVVSKTWGGARDIAMDSAKGYLDDLKAAGAPIKDEWYDAMKTAQEGAQQYDAAKIGRHGEIVPEEAVPYGTRKTQISQLAEKYGISTATEAGAPTDKKTLALIKKYAEVDYKSLEEVPLSVAEEAFKKRAGVDIAQSVTARLPAIETPEFKNWFGDSKIVDENGKPLVVYHGKGQNEVKTLPPVRDPGRELADKKIWDEFHAEAEKLGVTPSTNFDDLPDDIRRQYNAAIDKRIEKLSLLPPPPESTQIYSGAQLEGDAFKKGEVDLGIHFGTQEQANFFAGDEGVVIPAYLKVDNLVRLHANAFEFGKFTRTIDVLDEAGVLKASKIDSLRSKALELQGIYDKLDDARGFGDNPKVKSFWKSIRGSIEKGIDGLVYPNNIEGKGDSYVVFEPKQIKSAIGNTGKFDPNSADILDKDLAHFDESGQLVQPSRKRLLPPPVDGAPPTLARAIHEQMDGVTEIRKWVMGDIAENYGKKQLVDKVGEQAFRVAEKELRSKIAETRLISSRVAQANRDFTLLNYGEKSYWDVALSYLYPYHFWYKGTYQNWMRRLVMNPAILAHYNRYKENLATVHAGMPEWWKYNINSNDLPGYHRDNPWYFNLEATLWPLNGLTGTDFNDPSKRVNWWTSTLDFANKFGPSTWSPINILTGLALYAKGEKEAGEKWMGRLFPQSNVIKAGASKLGIANFETDPLVKFLQGGLDPYERRRVQRSLAEMEQEVIRGELPYTREQIQDAAYSQNGEIWDEAVKRAVNGRANSQISSFLFGVGFKGRTPEDMEIDKFQTDYGKLWAMRPNLTPEEFRQGMDKLKTQYPFMDTVLLSRRDDVTRDSGLAYMVMQRIPPGKTSDFAKALDMDPALLEKFYADKGQIEKWSPSDRLKFMSGIMTLSAVLEIPTDMTRGEWTKAKNAYSGLNTQAQDQFGDDILDLADGYWAAKSKSYQAADAYLEKHPEVSDYMNWRSERIMNSPLLSAYYGGASLVENYYRSKMYADIESKLGKDIFDVLDEYNDLKTFGTPTDQKAFYRQHKNEIKKYYQMKDGWQVEINQNVAQISAHLPEGEGATVREDYDVTSPTQTALAGAVEGEQPMTIEDFQQVIPERLQGLINDYFTAGERLPASAEKQLGRIANELGFGSVDDLLQAYGTTLYQTTP